MNEILQFLQTRNSSARLADPAPSKSELAEILRAAMRVPDHAWLRPWRFIAIAGERRQDFGRVLRRSLQRSQPGADAAALAKAASGPLRAPLLVAVVVTLSEHPKVPPMEQRFSAACAAHAILLAAEAIGYAGIWRTGSAAFDRAVMTELGLAANEELVGFVYLGTREGSPKNLPTLDTANFLSSW